MIFLPIVDRELRVAARKRNTFWVRLVAALIALVIGGGFLLISTIGPFGASSPSLGKGLFGTLTWLSLAVALASGLFFTSDCLSEEKREGTLGFLFLTDLRGFDVVLGKLLATSLRGTFALLAVFPILAITLLMGGVTGVQFWKTVLAIINALFLSLAAGLFVSALSRDSQKALSGTLLLLILLVALGPVADHVIATLTKRAFTPMLSLSSPGFLFVAGSLWPSAPFGTALLVNQVVGWTLLGLTSAILPRTWQEKSKRTSTDNQSWAYALKFGGAKRRAALRRRLLALNPALWLTCRERWQTGSLWIATLFLTGGLAVTFFNGRPAGWQIWSFFSWLFTLGLYLGIASQAGRFFVEARRSGLLELLLATPLFARQIVQGQWRAMLRLFGLPLLLCLATQLTGAFLAQQQAWKRMTAATAAIATPPAAAGTNTALPTNAVIVTNATVTTVRFAGSSATFQVADPEEPGAWVAMATAAASALTTLANLAALIWFGMWMGLTSRSSNLATLKTILFVQIVPWFAFVFAAGLILPLLLFPRIMSGAAQSPNWYILWFPLITAALTTVLALAKDFGFILWSRRKLHSEFRARAAQVAPIRMVLPEPTPRLVAPPPLRPA